MFELERRPLRQHFLAAAIGFALTFAAGMTVTVFVLTGGFPNLGADPPAMLWPNNARGPALPTFSATRAPEQAADASHRQAQAAASAPQGAARAPVKVELDTESLDSILNDGAAVATNAPASPPANAAKFANQDTIAPRDDAADQQTRMQEWSVR